MGIWELDVTPESRSKVCCSTLVPAVLADQPAAALGGDSREVAALGRRPP